MSNIAFFYSEFWPENANQEVKMYWLIVLIRREPFATGMHEMLGATVEIAKCSELHQFVEMPKRWGVERSFAWLEKCRRLWKNCVGMLNTSLQFVVLAFLVLLLRG